VLAAAPAARVELVAAGSFPADALIARERRVPILVFYTRFDCSWCDKARREFLLPLQRNPASAGRVLIREIEADSNTPLTDFSGRTTTHYTFARTRRVRLTPTLDFLDAGGNRLVEPIVGMRLPDYYATFIERAIDESLAKLRAEQK
jgi:thioredoxin-related protein